MTAKARLQEIFRSAFFDLFGWKKRLMQLSIGLAGVGAVAQGVVAFAETGEPGAGTWSFSALTSGAGCLLGFVVGAAFRIFLKLGLLVGGLVALVLFGLSSVGWIDLPWESLSEITGAVNTYVRDQTSSLKAALTSALPSSTMTGLGVLSGVTQTPDSEPDEE